MEGARRSGNSNTGTPSDAANVRTIAVLCNEPPTRVVKIYFPKKKLNNKSRTRNLFLGHLNHLFTLFGVIGELQVG